MGWFGKDKPEPEIPPLDWQDAVVLEPEVEPEPVKPPLYEGRLFSHGGNLFADQRTHIGDRVLSVYDKYGDPVIDENGEQLTYVHKVYETGPFHGHEVKHELGVGYVWVDRDAGDLGHFETHHKQFAPIVRTESEQDGTHHFAPAPDDPNFDEAGNLRYDADHIAEKITGHTDAYKES